MSVFWVWGLLLEYKKLLLNLLQAGYLGSLPVVLVMVVILVVVLMLIIRIGLAKAQ